MSGFKKQTTRSPLSKAMNESEFENGGRAQNLDAEHKVQEKSISTQSESKNKNNKTFSVLLPKELIDRLKRYQNSEYAKRVETQTYIFTQALTAWLDSKGFK